MSSINPADVRRQLAALGYVNVPDDLLYEFVGELETMSTSSQHPETHISASQRGVDLDTANAGEEEYEYEYVEEPVWAQKVAARPPPPAENEGGYEYEYEYAYVDGTGAVVDDNPLGVIGGVDVEDDSFAYYYNATTSSSARRPPQATGKRREDRQRPHTSAGKRGGGVDRENTTQYVNGTYSSRGASGQHRPPSKAGFIKSRPYTSHIYSRKSDKVRAFQRRQEKWADDPFLARTDPASAAAKKRLMGKKNVSGAVPIRPARKRHNLAKKRPTYVPPGEKSRRSLRWKIREQMWEEDPRFERKQLDLGREAQKNAYVPPTSRARKDLRWQIRQQMLS